MILRLGFDETSSVFESRAQYARVWTEGWVARELYCLNCGASRLSKLPNNHPVGDFSCSDCNEEYEIKSRAGKFGATVVDGAYSSMITRLAASNNPSLVLLGYDKLKKCVSNLAVVPKHFFIADIVKKRPPLASTARRAGWVGCNILLDRIPEAGKIAVIRNGELVPKELVLQRWKRTCFLRNQRPATRGWLLEIMKSVESIGNAEFEIADVYRFEEHLRRLYPGNNYIREKIRQQLQALRDAGFIEFLGKGRYRKKHTS